MVESHPVNRKKAFNMLFFIEFWERFGYYGLQAVLAGFFVKALGMEDAESFVVFGAFSAMVYGYVSLGGFLGDKILGTQRTITLGAVVLMIGYAMMALAGADKTMVFLALGAIACGNGIFKANPSSLLSKLYEGDEKDLDSAFTMYYMAVNIGSFISMLLVPIIGAQYGLSLGFMICAMGLILAVGGFLGFRYLVRGIDSPAGAEPLTMKEIVLTLIGVVVMTVFSSWLLSHLSVAHWLLFIIGVLVYGVFFKMIIQAKGAERSHMAAAMILIVEAIIFFTLYQQMPTSLNFFAIKNVEHSVLGIAIPNAEVFQTLNPFWIMLASPVLAWAYSHFGSEGKDLSMPAKFALGMLLTAASFLVVGFSANFANEAGIVSAWWLIGSYFLSSIGELLISGLGLSMISKLVPQKLIGFLMGAWFLTTSIAAILGGWVATLTTVSKDVVDPLQTLPVYSEVFTQIGLVTLGVTIVMALTVPMLNRLINKKDEEAFEGEPEAAVADK
ncbi:proton-dependent oligopeptide transporter, POT family [Selenomonas sp. WCT3]|uniref:oligopeptide:H+ symporter n=1 Tax=Selenomonas sp. WCT3 TaxID=3158785 RepID=UPI00087E3F1B|nr:proton-dependent oligopeptide transporter, POT family [Selenomonas ruminantium]